MMETHVLPPPVQMVQLLAGFQVSQALYVAASIGVADQLDDGPRTVAELAAKTSTHEESLHRLLRNLASFAVFTETEPGTFALTPLGETLTSDRPGSMRDLAIMWMETHYDPFGALLHTVRTGEPAADHFYGQPFFQWLSGRPEQVTRFSGAMANLTAGVKAAAIAALPLDGIQTLVDLGGSDGAVLSAILAAHPGMSGVLFDLPHVINQAPKAFAEMGISDRVSCVGGDFFDAVPSADGYLSSMVLHDWSDEKALRILRNVITAGGSGARLALVEFVVPGGDEPHMAKMIDLTMLGMLTGKERTEQDWRKLLGAAGFGGIQFISTPSPLSVILATAQ